MADPEFDITSFLEVSYEIVKPESNSESSSAHNRPDNEGEVVLGLVPDEDWMGNRLSKKEDKEIEDAERTFIHKKIQQCDERAKVQVSFTQHIANGRECSNSAIRDNSAVLPMETSSVTERKVSIIEHYRCTTCSMVFSDFSLMSKHSRTHPPRKKPFACNMCGKEVTELSNLKRHIRFHTGEASLACNICNKMFHTPDMLKIHMRYHSGGFPIITDDALSRFRCHICMRPFAKQSHLNKHFHIHTLEKKFLHQGPTIRHIQQQS